MQILEVERLGPTPHLNKTAPERGHIQRVVDESCLIMCEGKPLALYLVLPEEQCAAMRRAVGATKAVATTRSRGLPTQSSVFGSMPRVSIRCDYCRYTQQTRKEPANWAAVRSFAEVVAQAYREYFPAKYTEAMQALASQVNPAWRGLGEGLPFTTANINMNHAIRYHRDSGNVRQALSNVFILKRGIKGGELVFPEYGVALSQRDRALAIFDGQAELHGCTPIEKVPGALESYRASIVFYTLDGMKNCADQAGEVQRMQSLRTAKEAISREERNAKLKKMAPQLASKEGS